MKSQDIKLQLESELQKRPAFIANRITVEVDDNIQITYVVPDGLAGAIKYYQIDDTSNAVTDIQNFC